MVRRRVFGRRRGSADLWLMLAVQRATIAMLAARLDLVQRDAETALEALTEAEGRIADLESRVFGPVSFTPPRKTWLAAIPELPWVAEIAGA